MLNDITQLEHAWENIKEAVLNSIGPDAEEDLKIVEDVVKYVIAINQKGRQ